MITLWAILLFLVFYPLVAAIIGTKQKEKKPKQKNLFYLKDVIFPIIFLMTIYLLVPAFFNKPDFDKIGRGILIDRDLIRDISLIFFIPFLLSLTPWNIYYPKNISEAKELFGYPVSLLPNNTKEFFFFNIYIITGVIFEELFCRQFLFFAFYETLNFKGDVLLIISSALFAVGHIYQGWKGVLTSLLLGLIYGKIFQISGTIFYPIVLHLCLNLTVSVLGFKRIKDLKKIGKSSNSINFNSNFNKPSI